MGKNIPVYDINRFKKDPVKRKQYQAETFDKNRNFQVEYPHRHGDFYELLFITQGNGKYSIDFQDYEIKPEHIYFVSPGQVHSIDVSDDIFGYIFLFDSEFYLIDQTEKNKLEEFPFFHSIGGPNPPFHVGENSAEYKQLFQLAIRESGEDTHQSQEITRAILNLILQLIKKHYPIHDEEITGKGRMLVKNFKQLIEEHFQNFHSVQEYSNLLAVTPNHLNETVKQLTGINAKEHIKNRQLLEIKRLLSHTELNISEIAYSLNFEDQSYFSRFFKKFTGMTPNEFRLKAIKST